MSAKQSISVWAVIVFLWTGKQATDVLTTIKAHLLQSDFCEFAKMLPTRLSAYCLVIKEKTAKQV